MKKAFFLMTLLGVSALLVQISNSSQTDSNTIQIIIGDFYFKPKTIQLRAGQQVKIELVNEGKLEHEFMVGRGLKTEEGKDETHKGMHEANEEKQETSKGEHEHQGETHAHSGMSKGFEKDFFEGVEVAVQTEKGSDFMKVPSHGNMVTLKPEGEAALTFKIPTDRKGEWQMACFVPGHYEAKMKGKIIIK
jgi:uncharacterized cupredoxin-like copper-binding protein